MDILLTALTAVVALAEAVLGVFLTLKEQPRGRHAYFIMAFVVLGLAGLGVAVIQQNRNSRAQEALQKKLDEAVGEARLAKEEASAARREAKEQGEAEIKAIAGLPSSLNRLPGFQATPVIQERPDIALRFVHPAEVGLTMLNRSKRAVLRQPKYGVVLWNLDAPSDAPPTNAIYNPLPIPWSTGDFIRPGESLGPNQIIGIPAVLARVKKGDRLFGYAMALCPSCQRTRTYWVFIRHGDGGWYSEEPQGVNLEALAKAIPKISKDDTVLGEIAPVERRVQIE